jgi:restriction endonuclease
MRGRDRCGAPPAANPGGNSSALRKGAALFAKGIKVLTLFFIDEVAKYRVYEGSLEKQGEYAAIFEDEY